VNIMWKVLYSRWKVVFGSGIGTCVEGIIVNIFWRILHSSFTELLDLEWKTLPLTLCVKYCTASGQ